MIAGAALKEHTLNRLGYGQSLWHSARYEEVGFDAYVGEQLDDSLGATTQNGTTIDSKIERSVVSERQLEVTLIDFWFNHFNIDTIDTRPNQREKTIAGRMVGYHQNTAIKPHVLGDFGAMLLATAKSPSMLDYLDNRLNFEVEVVNGKEYGLNENYAREVMELHALGVGGGYSEQDVTEVARILTGWSVASDAYKFKSARHDKGAKSVMGVDYPAGRNEEEGEDFMQFLADHPSAAAFLSYKICRRFISDIPSAGAVAAASAAYASSGGDLRQVMTALFATDDFKNDTHFRSKVKPPHRYVASALLAMGAQTKSHYSGVSDEMVEGVEACGEIPYVVSPPTGYPENSAYWISGASMLSRFKIAESIANNASLRDRVKDRAGVTGSSVDQTVDGLAAVIIPGGIAAASRAAIINHVTANASTNNERVSAAAQMILSAPEFVRF